MTISEQVINLIFGLSVTFTIIGLMMFLAIKAADYINKKDGKNKH